MGMSRSINAFQARELQRAGAPPRARYTDIHLPNQSGPTDPRIDGGKDQERANASLANQAQQQARRKRGRKISQPRSMGGKR